MIHYLETNSMDPYYNLAFEQYILENKTSGDWLILWQNLNTIVIGLNQNAAEEINREFVESNGINVVRRMTGGGAVYHDVGNLNYSFITDLGDSENVTIARFNEPVIRALRKLGICAENSGRNDITVEGKKISGVAQRVYKGRILHHGCILFDSNANMVSGALNADPAKFKSKSSKSVRSRVTNVRPHLKQDMSMKEFHNVIVEEFSNDGIIKEALTTEEIIFINSLAADKYRSWDWTWGKNPAYTVKNRARFDGGSVCVEVEVARGIIKNIEIFGDFMAVTDCSPVKNSLKGIRFEKKPIEEAMSGMDIKSIFGGITLDEIISVILP